jgi:hypothetical protein
MQTFQVLPFCHTALDRDQWQVLANAVMNLWVPSNAGNFLNSRATIIFSRMTLLHRVTFSLTTMTVVKEKVKPTVLQHPAVNLILRETHFLFVTLKYS